MDDDGKDSLFHWKFLPFGLKNALAEFQRIINQVLKGLPFARCYIDNVIIFSDSPSKHVRHLQQAFERLRAWGLRLHHGKCKFFHDMLAYLGHMIVPGGLGVQMAKVEALNKIPILRMCRGCEPSWVWRTTTVGSCATSMIAKPLTQLTRTGQDWEWEPAQDEAFEALKKALGSALVLRRPDTRRPFQLHTNWSMLGLGAVLTQKDDDGKEYVIVYASRSNNDAEAKYSSYERECLAVVWAVAHFDLTCTARVSHW